MPKENRSPRRWRQTPHTASQVCGGVLRFNAWKLELRNHCEKSEKLIAFMPLGEPLLKIP
jgi:hypothetical protein